MDQTQLARRLGLFDATMIVMGGIIGSGIFMNPSVVALQVHTPFLILGAWIIGDSVEFVELVLAETFGAEAGDAKTKTGDDQNDKCGEDKCFAVC